ncbi:hypothetical protein GCM10008956_23340 [Deinococcus arenae]|uniref:Four helix bundle protein n=1 Tax=Deinococcus arenae TaxID=1452751 RepID=A0A8H9L7M8_9DEIO|nr:four helix bundle protein [Deinococcus arenae]AWT34972.1 four helix bundle protein [Deinococcus actinosclerus]GGM46497.1 hypothetical protein GCM10008956_23340 [Deinococcus arenae]
MDSHFPFEQLDVYQLSVAYATQVYRATTTFPDTEKFGLTNQMRRAAVSISLNIAEGRGRGGDRELVRYLMIARGSLFEVVAGAQIAGAQIAEQLGFLNVEAARTLRQDAHTLSAKLMTLIKRLTPTS